MSTATVENGQQQNNATDNPPAGNAPKTPPAVVTKPPAREVRVVRDDSELANLLDTARFEHMQRIAQSMGVATVLPDHLRLDKAGKELPDNRVIANCLLVVNQALRWGVDPFALAAESYVVGGKLAYQGKLVAAIVNTRAGLLGRLWVTYNEQPGDKLAITVHGQFPNEAEPRTVTVAVSEARTQNQMWTKDPRQKLWYTGAIKWARRHCPEVLLGVLTDDDAERMSEPGTRTIESHVIPSGQSKSDALAQQMQSRRATESNAEGLSESGEQSQVEQKSDPKAALEQEIADKMLTAIGTANDLARLDEIVSEVDLLVTESIRTQLHGEIGARRAVLKKRTEGKLPGTA